MRDPGSSPLILVPDECSKGAMIELLMTIPRVSTLTAQGIIVEIGTDMNTFPNEHHLASWAGMSPGNNQSGGKKKRTNNKGKQPFTGYPD